MTPRAKLKVVRAIAIVEGGKGALALIAGIGLLLLVHRNVQSVAEQFLRLAHLDPASRYARAFLDAAGGITDVQLGLLAFVAVVYAAIRAAEAFWLWNDRPWAEWFALGSTAFYLPVEIYELCQEVTGIMLGVLCVNVAIVAYLAKTLHQQTKWKRALVRSHRA
jgi:uncharacterized membrane protein (DUF2068 family)